MQEATILIIENSEKIVGKISGPLERAGYRIQSVRWAEEGLSIVQQGGIDIVLVHTKQAGMNGIQFTLTLRQNERFLIRPIVFIYGKDDIETKIQAFKAGADDYLVLPFSIPELLVRMDVRLRKTALDESEVDRESLKPQYKEMDLLPSFKKEGSLVSTSLPYLFSAIALSNLTGILRLIQGRIVRTFFFEDGYIRAAGSSNKKEMLSRHLVKWKAITGENKKRFVKFTRAGSEKSISETFARLTGANRMLLNGLAIRHIQAICSSAVKMNKGDYDWVEGDDPSDMFIADFRGVHPFHLLLSVYRSMFFLPDYTVFYPKPTQWIFPSARFGRLRDKFMFTAAEECVLALTEKGIAFSNLIQQSRQIIRHGGPFIYSALCFYLLFAGEKRPVSQVESAAVSLDPVAKKVESASGELVSSDTSAGLKIDLEKITPKVNTKSEEVDLANDRIKPEEPGGVPVSAVEPKTVLRPKVESPAQVKQPSESPKPLVSKQSELSSVKVENRQSDPVSPSAVSNKDGSPTSKPQVSRGSKPRKVRELYPVKPEEEKAIQKGLSGPLSFGFKPKHLLSGELSKVPFPFLYALAMSPQTTGIQIIHVNEYETKLFWRRGHMIFARSDNPKLRIDQIMVDMKMISPEQKSQVDKMIQEMGKMRSGTLIFKNQMVNMLQLSEAIQKQMVLILEELFNASGGTYRFNEGALPPDEHIPLDIGTEKVFMEQLINLKNVDPLDPFLPERGSLFIQTDDAASKITRYRLGGKVTTVFDKFRKPITVHEGVVGLDIPLKNFKVIVLGLVLLGLLCPVKVHKSS